MKLYQDNGNFSPNVKRVRVMCNEVGAPVEHVPMDFMKGEWRTPEYLAKNPNGKVPTLDDDGYLLWESPAILFHLASKYGERGLLPTDARGKTEMMRWLFWNASHLEQSVNGLVVEKVIKPMMGQSTDNARVESSTKDWERYAPILNGHLEGKQYVVGTYSIVDIAYATTVEMAVACGIDLTKYPHINAWYGRVTSRDAWKRASVKK